jgi:hypothetical protein
MRFCLGRSLVALLLVTTTAACGSFTDPSKNQTDTLTGTLQPRNTDTKTFVAAKTGEFTIKLTALMPPFANFLTVIYSQQVGGNCSLVFQRNDFVLVGNLVAAGRIDAGTYCITIADQGTMTTAQTYTFTVTHP